VCHEGSKSGLKKIDAPSNTWYARIAPIANHAAGIEIAAGVFAIAEFVTESSPRAALLPLELQPGLALHLL